MVKIRKYHKPAFTLIELLIVVAIIAILAALAIPNFLEAQTRSKVSRVMSELRTVATCLEAYAVDSNDYPPNDGVYNVLPIQLTTPIAYLTNTLFKDPFAEKELHPVYGELERLYTYTKVVWSEGEGPDPPIEGIDDPGYNEGAFERYGRWRLVSFGPDKKYSRPGFPLGPFNPNHTLRGSDVTYDATNGTVSWGNILRTQKATEGFLLK